MCPLQPNQVLKHPHVTCAELNEAKQNRLLAGDRGPLGGMGVVVPIVKSRKGSCMTSPQLGLSMGIKPSLVGIKPSLDAIFDC